jgi:hypothetical protein
MGPWAKPQPAMYHVAHLLPGCCRDVANGHTAKRPPLCRIAKTSPIAGQSFTHGIATIDQTHAPVPRGRIMIRHFQAHLPDH